MFNLKEYKAKYDSKIKDKENKKPLKEEKDVSFEELFSDYTDRVTESAEESLLDYGVIRNPITGKTIVGVDEIEEEIENKKYDSFIFLYLDTEDVINVLNNIEDGYFDSVEFSKGEIIDAINKNDNDVSSVIATLMIYGGEGNTIYTEIESQKDFPMDLESIKEVVSNEDMGDDEELEPIFNDEGELDSFGESKKSDIKKYLPEAKSYKYTENDLVFEDGYKIMFKDDTGNCKLLDRTDTEKKAKIIAESIVKRLENRELSTGSKIFIYSPYSISDKPFKVVTESNEISLAEEVGAGDGLGDIEKNEFEEKCNKTMNEEENETNIKQPVEGENFDYQVNDDGVVEMIIPDIEYTGDIVKDVNDIYKKYPSFSPETSYIYLLGGENSEGYKGFDMYGVNIEGVDDMDDDDIVDEAMGRRDGTGSYGRRNRKATEGCPYDESNDVDYTNDACWKVLTVSENSNLMNKLNTMLNKEDYENFTSDDFKKSLKFLEPYFDDKDSNYEEYTDVLEKFKNHEEIDGYIIGEFPNGDIVVYAKGEYTVNN